MFFQLNVSILKLKVPAFQLNVQIESFRFSFLFSASAHYIHVLSECVWNQWEAWAHQV